MKLSDLGKLLCPSPQRKKYPAETGNTLVQRFRDKGSVADRKRSGSASIVETKVADVEATLQRSPMK
ncbi:hypothetical protein TNCV_1380951 [Trichonephila clavipes]|nr:hypothetical protein TNCV_1380951 [Trichonephila clavipes]